MTKETAGTPRVDALVKPFTRGIRLTRPTENAVLDLARQLEREVAALTAERDELQKRIGYTAVPLVAGGARSTASGSHTPEPWSIHHQASTAINGSKGWVVATCGGHSDNRRGADDLFDELTANARRIVACVNYCVGQDTGKLESDYAQGYSAFDHVAHLLATGTAQATECETNETEGLRAELDAAKRALAELVNYDKTFPDVLSGDVPARLNMLMATVRAALAAKSAEHKKEETCPSCKGSGEGPPTQYGDQEWDPGHCPACSGTGVIIHQHGSL